MQTVYTTIPDMKPCVPKRNTDELYLSKTAIMP